jgi:hypothetical protein
MAHRVCSSLHSSAVSDCSAPPHCSPLRAHGCCMRMHVQRSPCTPQHTAQHTSSTHTDCQPRPFTIAEVQALQLKWRTLHCCRASSVALLTCRVGGILMRHSYVRLLVVFPGPSTLPTPPPSLLDECAPLLAERNPKRHTCCGRLVVSVEEYSSSDREYSSRRLSFADSLYFFVQAQRRVFVERLFCRQRNVSKGERPSDLLKTPAKQLKHSI